MKSNFTLPLISLSIIIITACSPANYPVADETLPTKSATALQPAAPTVITSDEKTSIYTTQNNLSGNHLVNGTTDLTSATTLDIPLDGKPIWLVSAPFKDSIVFAAALDNGNTQAFRISGASYETFDISPAQLPAGIPPALIVTDNNLQLLVPPDGASSLTNPILVNGKLIYISSNGDLVMIDSESQTRLPINALLDSRILVDEKDRLVVLTEPTNRYNHGIAGDDLEASAIVLVETEPEARVTQTIPIAEPDVIEGISAIWADIDNDGARDIIVTLSNSQTGARIVAYRENGTLLAESDAIGRGNRWRHQLSVAGFKPNKPQLLVDVRTPHIGGIVEFFQYNNGKLESVQEIRGFSTHSIGSRNLDAAIAGDFNNDGIIELLAPDQGHINLGIISLDGVVATLPLDSVLTSNLTAAELDGKLYIGAGTEGNLRVWVPPNQ